MAARDRLGLWRRLLNALVRILLLVGLGPHHTSRLTVQGRRTGTWDSTPVTLVEDGTHRWLGSSGGGVPRVRNARVAGQPTLNRGRRSNRVHHDLGYTVPFTKGGTAHVTVSQSSHPYDRRARFDELDRGGVPSTGPPSLRWPSWGTWPTGPCTGAVDWRDAIRRRLNMGFGRSGNR